MNPKDNSRQTSIFKSIGLNPSRTTRIQNNAPERETAILNTEKHNPDRTTQILNSDNPSPASLLQENAQINRFKVAKVLAENTGEATLLLCSDGNKQCVLKVFHQNIQPKTELRQTLAEIGNIHIMPVIESDVWQGRYYEVLPYYDELDLGHNLPIDEQLLLTVVIPGINDGLHALHQAHIVHRDIKPSNIFFSNNRTNVVIGDFGISSVLSTNMSVRATGMARTLGYAAPETSTGYISKESDYYSFGITLLHILLGHDPFEGMTDMQILFQTVNENLNIPSSVNPRLQTLIRGLTIKDRNLRWGYKEVCNWVEGKDFELPIQGQERKTLNGEKARPYRFANMYYYSLPELERAFAKDWTNAKKHLYRGLVEKYLALYGEDLVSQCIDLREMSNKDAAAFRLQYLLDPNAPLSYKQHEFGTTAELGRCMLESFPASMTICASLITDGSLQFYLDLHQQLTSDLSDKLTQYEKSGTVTREDYLEIAYILNPLKGFDLDEKSFSTLEELSSYLTSLDHQKCEASCRRIMNSEFFPAWVRSLGYETQVLQWKDMINKSGWNT